MTEFRGRLIVVTGAARGQGWATAHLLASQGADVIALDIDAHAPDSLPDGVTYRQLDVTQPQDWRELAAYFAGRTVHGLVNNAGTTWRARLLDVEVADFTRVHSVNVVGPLLGIQSLVPLMISGSAIVNVGSVAGLTGHYPIAYTSSKWALRGLSKVASMELGPAGIRVNTIHPGYIETAMTASASEVFRLSNLAETPLGRVGQATEIATLALFLLSDAASYLTGAEISADGGMSAHGGVKSISDAMLNAAGSASS